MIFTFYKARGLNVGSSLVEEDKLALAKELEEKAKVRFGLVCDGVTWNVWGWSCGQPKWACLVTRVRMAVAVQASWLHQQGP